jgi:SAM-dependent methyltransferase
MHAALPGFFWYILKNCSKNMLMRICPDLIIRLRQPTGTGDPHIDSDLSAAVDYSRSVFEKYLRFLGAQDRAGFLAGKSVLEIGPGDTVTIALLFLAYGAARVICFDRFPLVQNREKNRLSALRLLEILPAQQKARLEKIISFDGSADITRDRDCLRYSHDATGAIPAQDATIDLVVSNAVLEHVSDLEALFCEMARSMKPGAAMVHAADLGPHQLDFRTALDFLAVPERLWQMMTSHRGAPNRARKSCYELLLKKHCFEILKFEVTERFTPEDIDLITASVPHLRQTMSREDLSCRSILFSARKTAAAAAPGM